MQGDRTAGGPFRRRAARLLRRPDVARLLDRIAADYPITVSDTAGTPLYGVASTDDDDAHPVDAADGAVVAEVRGPAPVASLVAGALAALVAVDDERRQIADEALGLYREVNLLYALAQRLAQTDGRGELVARTLAEATKLVDAESAMVVVDDGTGATVAASTGVRVAPPADLIRARIDEDGSLLVSPLDVGEAHRGAIVVRRQRPFVAADAKLIGAVAAQAGAVLERVLDEERRAAVAMARELRLQEQIAALRIELDEQRQHEQVKQITESDYYGGLRSEAADLRRILKGGEARPT